MEIIAAFFAGTLEDVFAFVLMLFVTIFIVITVHEWGHYIAARYFGVRVEEFSFGFGRKLFSFGGKGENDTYFAFRAFPIAGYIKLFGDVDPENPQIWDSEKEEARSLSSLEKEYAYCTKPAWQRLIIVLAGPMINILLALLILISAYISIGQRSRPIVIDAIAIEKPAHKAGIKPGDKIISIDGKHNRRIEDVYDHTWYELPPKPHSYKVMRGGNIFEVTFSAIEREYENDKGVKMHHGQTGMCNLGAVNIKKVITSINGVDVRNAPDKARNIISANFNKEITVGMYSGIINDKNGEDLFLVNFPAKFNKHFANPEDENYKYAFLADSEEKLYVKLPFTEAVERALFNLAKGISSSYKLIEAGIKGKNDDQLVAGFGKMSKTIGKAVKAGPYDYIMIIASFSLMIAIINILPIPALDGGYIIFLLYEIIMGKAVPLRFQTIAIITGLVILLGIMIFANVSDIISFASDKSSD